MRKRQMTGLNKLAANQFPQRADEVFAAAGAGQKSPGLRQILFPDIHKARGRDDLDRRPAAPASNWLVATA